MDILTKTIGLLVDLVLFPFLPLIVYFLMKFVTFTVTLGMMWKDLTKQLGMPLGLSITAGGAILGMLLAGAAVSAIVNLIAAGEAWLLLLLTGAGKYVVSAIADIVARGAAWLLKLLAGAPLSVQIVAAVALGLVIGAAVVKLLEVSGALDAIYRAGENIRKNNAEWFQSLYNNIGPVQNALNTLADMMNSVLGTSFLTNKKMSELISTGTYNAETIKRLREKYGMGVSYSAMGGYTLAGRRLESFQSGGVIPGPIGAPRVVTVHGGERVVPAGKSVGDTTVNFYGYQDDKFVAKVKEIMRREGARYQV
jgi:hypothetical protein